MKLFALSLLLGISSFLYSQCSFIKNTRDEFKGYEIKKTHPERILFAFSQGATVDITKIDSAFYINFMYSTNILYSASKGNELIFKMSDSTFITLTNLEYEIADGVYMSGIAVYTATMTFPINKEDIKKLQKNDIIKFRFYTNDGYVEHDVKPKHSILISALANCILTN